MAYTLTLNPLIVVQFAAVAQTVIMAILVSVPRQSKPPSKRAAGALDFFRVFGYCGLAVLSVLFLDTGVAWLAGAWGYADWRYQLPSAVLLVVIGVEYAVAGLLKRCSWVSLAYIVVVAAILLLFIHVFVSAEVLMGNLLENGLPIVLGALVGAGVLVAGLETALATRQEGRKGRLTWDISHVMNRVFNRWTNLVIWALVVVQGILLFSGYSLLTFWMP
ncbi:MAG: hypothetical protein JW839_09340 [Candidatus Lokiarchaeota archaeon]|nr:hypothetical protein [Candidatus Lokiarchaeota archaeon]